MSSTRSDWQSFEGWEVFECPKCGTQWGLGTGGKSTRPPTCSMGHTPTEMEQKVEKAMPRELRDRAERDPVIRLDLNRVLLGPIPPEPSLRRHALNVLVGWWKAR